jgi:hypothetical protein
MAQKPRLFFDDDQPFCPPLTVYEHETENVDTGLLDANGVKIFRQPERQRIGFDLTPRGGR